MSADSRPIVEIAGLSKRYQLGGLSAATLRDAAQEWWEKRRQPRVPTPELPTTRTDAAGKVFWALRDITFNVERGQVVGLLGRNGAGKSTLLKILSRITEPTSGRAILRGRVASLLEVGTGFHPDLTGRENIYLNGAILGMKRAEITRVLDAIVDFAEIGAFLHTPVKRYSSGMYVRLAFAVAAHLEPEILIVDEVLSVGDAAFQKKCLGKMRSVAASEGRTVLFVTHNMGAIKSLCQSVVWLRDGQVAAQGATEPIVDQYLRETLGENSGTVDFCTLERPTWAESNFRLERVEFNGGAPVQHGEPLVVKIDYRSSTAREDVSVGFGFATLEGTRLLSLDSDLGEARRALPAGACGSVTVRLDKLHLQPGRYALDIGARSGDSAPLDYLSGCAMIDVLPGPATPGMIVREGGGVRQPAAWLWQTRNGHE